MYHNRRKMGALIVASALCCTLIGRDICIRHSQVNLISSIEKRDIAGVERALAWGANPNGSADTAALALACPGQTATTFAALQDSPQIVELLVTAGGLVDGADANGRTPLVEAIYMHNTLMCSTLLALGANPFKRGTNPFCTSMVETPMDALAFEAVAIAPERITTMRYRESKRKILSMYQMLKRRGVLPTLAQALETGNEDEMKSLIAAERLGDPMGPGLQHHHDSRSLDSSMYHSNGLDTLDSSPILKFDWGI